MLILPPTDSHSAYPHELLKHVLAAQTVGNLNRKTSISAVCFWLRWHGNNSCCWKSLGKSCRTSWMVFQEKLCWANITAPHVTNPPSVQSNIISCTSINQPAADLNVLAVNPISGALSEELIPTSPSIRQAGEAIVLSRIVALFETSHQGKMSFRSFCASCSLWASFTTEAHQQILYFSDSHSFPYWRLKLILQTQEKCKTHRC